MPTYDYLCRSCGSVTEVIHSMLEEGPSACERCGGELRRVLFPTGIIFKGTGFYRNDSRAKGAAPTSESTAPASSGAPTAKADTPKSDSGTTPSPTTD